MAYETSAGLSCLMTWVAESEGAQCEPMLLRVRHDELDHDALCLSVQTVWRSESDEHEFGDMLLQLVTVRARQRDGLTEGQLLSCMREAILYLVKMCALKWNPDGSYWELRLDETEDKLDREGVDWRAASLHRVPKPPEEN